MAKDLTNIINHFAIVLDESSSMSQHKLSVIKLIDNEIAHLAERSTVLDQETRVSIWAFADRVRCIVWDKDVLRLPSISTFYKPNGNTAFVDATLESVEALSETPERYGDHSYLVYVVTDGADNRSSTPGSQLRKRLDGLPDHWTVAALVPDARAKHETKNFGFPAGNVQIWDINSKSGVEELGDTVRKATDVYMEQRARGVRSTRTLFSTDASAVNAATIAQAHLTTVPRGSYLLAPVPTDCTIVDFTRACGHDYRLGSGFYELMKTEWIQPQKQIAIVERGAGARVYIGQAARDMIGLGDQLVRVKPDYNADYAVFVQSTSINRKLKAGTRYLYLIK